MQNTTTQTLRSASGRALRSVLYAVLAAALLASTACKDVLKVQDPQNFASTTLDNPILWPAIANGSEGDFHRLPFTDYFNEACRCLACSRCVAIAGRTFSISPLSSAFFAFGMSTLSIASRTCWW